MNDQMYVLSYHGEVIEETVSEEDRGVVSMEWISVKVALPTKDDYNEEHVVLAAHSSGHVGFSFSLEPVSKGWMFENLYGKVTHWMRTPKAPGGEGI